MEDQTAAASSPQGEELRQQDGRGEPHLNGKSSASSSGPDAGPQQRQRQQQPSRAEESQHRSENGVAEGLDEALTEAEERRIAADMQKAAKQQAAAGIKPPELQFELRRLHSAVLTQKVCG